jgi:hypothetical protein
MSNLVPGVKSVAARLANSPFHAPGTSPSTFSCDSFSIGLEERESPLTESESRSSDQTRAALLALEDCPTDTHALRILWEENHLAFESQMSRHLGSPDSPALRERVLSGMVSVCRFYCAEIDDPKAWVARCANLETRRVALQLRK